MVEDTAERSRRRRPRRRRARKKKGEYLGRAVILTTGTFLRRPALRRGEARRRRIHEPSAENLSDSLRKIGFEIGRLKTGTPARLKRSSSISERPRSGRRRRRSHFTTPSCPSRRWSAGSPIRTDDPRDHPREPPSGARATAARSVGGPCPSIEPGRPVPREDHQIFLGPDAWRESIYVNGTSTSTPPTSGGVYPRSPGSRKPSSCATATRSSTTTRRPPSCGPPSRRAASAASTSPARSTARAATRKRAARGSSRASTPRCSSRAGPRSCSGATRGTSGS